MNVAIVGVTGLVGRTMLKGLEERSFPVSKLIPIASKRSKGQKVKFGDLYYEIVTLEESMDLDIDLALFSIGGELSKIWAPKFTERGCFVIDNSSAWRMDSNVPLIVPEVNASVLKATDLLIANPNCSTIQLVVALSPLHTKYKIERLVISTYQSMTGTGKIALDQYESEKMEKNVPSDKMAYAHQIFENCIPHCDTFQSNDYTKEEMKLVHETRKILNDEELKITATAVRVPVKGGHSESVNISFKKPFQIANIKKELSEAPGVTLKDDISNNDYPHPQYSANKDEVFVGRVRRDDTIKNGLNMFVVADNLRKGAATNSIQIAEYLIEKSYI